MADHHSRKRRRPAELGPPPRWLNCPRKGALIAEKFLPFKTPLSEIYDAQVPEESRFPPSMLLDSLTSYKLKMGLWIDLTNTDRFYDPKVIEQREIRYLKLQCRGHGECPSQEQTDTFIGICQRFISMNPLHIIGVHCTHGFNRTGFLIASYLVVNMSWSIEAAVKALAEARPPGIYKADYLRELFKRYGDVDDTPPPPPRPSWCDEENEDLDDDGNALGGDGGGDGPVHKRRRREFTKKNPTFMEGVSGVVPVTTQPKLLQIQRRCQELCHWESSGFPGSQPVSMDRQNIHKLREKEYMVSWKADGTRYMMLIDGENEVYFIDRDNCVFQVSNLYFPRRKDRTQHIQETLVDGEMIIDEDNGRKVPRYLIYDIIRFQGEEVWGVDFCRRLTCISRELYEPRKAAMQEGRINRDNEPFGVRHKQFWDAAVTYKLLSDKFAQSMPHELDGLIFQPKMDSYVCGRANDVLKWKPPHLNTIDFRLKITKDSGPGVVPKNIGLLYVGGCDHPFGRLKWAKQLKELDNKIVECKIDGSQWVLLRERTDKSFPNSFSTAEGVMESIRNPVDKDYLLNFIRQYGWRRKPTDSELMPPPHQVAQ
ncbi:mRNA-capping enzyme [Dermacentor silvarum]|uniref:mRNA-capping enzyme n=1 Tax=Dermacentor silvarum TaxID=543639 RepID=UPI0018976EA4|nr:mRNA-capping enzyme [Dermacentor silvarum]